MKELKVKTILLIEQELKSIPSEYQNNFNSIHEGYAVILEEVRELESEVFFGKKRLLNETKVDYSTVDMKHRERMRNECVQIAAMCIRFIQEL